MSVSAKIERRFWKRIEKSAHCWEWKGYQNGYGYGLIGVGIRRLMAHRISWQIHHGPIPEGLCVLHRCDNRACVRPDHLFLGTLSENSLDRHLKGRSAFGMRHGMAKLSEDGIKRIRLKYSGGGISQGKLAEEYGVAKSLIWAILRRKIWKHLQ